MDEADITINGKTLSTGQALALRVAASNFLGELDDVSALGDDEHGKAMAVAYKERLIEVLLMMRK